MEILRLSEEVIKENKQKIVGKDEFKDTYQGVDKIELDNSLLVEILAKYENVKPEELLYTDAYIKVEYEHDVDIIDRIIIVNDARYAFFLATAGDTKKSSCIFIKEEYYGFCEFMKDQATGFVRYKLAEKEQVTIMKELAYEGLIASGSKRTNQMPYWIMIDEPMFNYKGNHLVLKGVETAQSLDDIHLVEEEIKKELRAFDGQGIMSKNLADRIAKDLDINYQLEWVVFRIYGGVGGKGVVTTVDIHEELLKVNKQYGNTEFLYMEDGELIILDKWGKPHKVSEVDMILNQSQCKLLKYFTPEELEHTRNNVDDIFKYLYVCKYNPENLSSSRTKLNYQGLQAMNLSYEELLELTKSDREHLTASLTDMDSLLITCDLADIQDEDDIEGKKQNDSFSLMLELVRYDSKLLKDWSVQQHMQKLLKSRINKVAYGKVTLEDASYRLMIQDVKPYLNFCATRDMEKSRDNTCLQANEFYSIGRPEGQRTVGMRNPLSSHQELLRFENKKNEFMDSLGYKSNSVVVYNTYDATATTRNSGADHDGDILCCIVNDTIYNSVIEFDDIFFNTADGGKNDKPYNKENISEMIKSCSGNFIGSLAILSSGVMNACNEFPYMLQDGTLLSNREFFNKVKTEFKLDNNQEVSLKMQELIQSGAVVDTMTTTLYTPEQKKEFIRKRHEELRKIQYLILYAGQTAIDTSKTGIKLGDNLQKILKGISEKPYFLKFARGEKHVTVRNSVLDRFAHDCSRHYYTQSFNFMKDVCFTIEDEVKPSKKNVFIDMFNRASAGANENNVAVIVKELNDMYTKYKSTRQALRNANKETDYYKSTHEDNNYRAYSMCNKWYRICSESIDGYTLEDLYSTIVAVNFRNDFILNYLTQAIVDVVKANNPKVRKFYKGEHPEKEGAKIIQIGNKTYTRTFEFIDESKLGESVQLLRLKHMVKEQEKYSNALQIRFKSETSELRDGDLCIAIKNKDGYSYRLIVNNQVVVYNAYLYKNKKQIIDKEQLCICDIRFNRNLSKNVEYNGYILY
ncbi:Uncharacterised protein [uncultured Clostridium sp.]|nr:Uncharacterised protein [uncultured Clostridium sp.]